MAKSKRKSLSQKVVGVATSGMPSPVRKLLGTRIIALLIILAIPVLLATGIVSVQWKDGRPDVSIDRERAAEVRQDVREKVHAFREDQQGERPAVSDIVPHFREQEPTLPIFSNDSQSAEGFGERVTEGFDNFREGVTEQGQQAWSNASTALRHEEEEAKQAFRPLSGLRDRFEGQQR